MDLKNLCIRNWPETNRICHILKILGEAENLDSMMQKKLYSKFCQNWSFWPFRGAQQLFRGSQAKFTALNPFQYVFKVGRLCADLAQLLKAIEKLLMFFLSPSHTYKLWSLSLSSSQSKKDLLAGRFKADNGAFLDLKQICVFRDYFWLLHGQEDFEWCQIFLTLNVT